MVAAAERPAGATATPTLGEAFSEYLSILKPEQRQAQEAYIRKYIDYAGDGTLANSLTGSRVESYAEAQIKTSDPNAPDRVAALKAWFQFLKKREYTTANYGVNIRARRSPGRPAGVGSTIRRDESPIEMTADGLAILRKELADLETQHLELVKAIEIARSDGDLKENAPYHAAREALGMTMNRKKNVEESVRRAVVVEHRTDDRTAVGSKVTITNVDEDRQFKYTLVSAREANATELKISVDSPVGRQLLGRRPGDQVAVTTPRGEVTFRIDAVTQ
jgi:transcription elongation factor GreA